MRQAEALADLPCCGAGLLGRRDRRHRLVGQPLLELMWLVGSAGERRLGRWSVHALLQVPYQPIDPLDDAVVFGGTPKHLHQGVPASAYSNPGRNERNAR